MLLEFHGQECPHCVVMAPLIARLEQETGLKVKQYEVWHNAANAGKMQEYDKGLCGGVPFFFNTESGKYICGEESYENLKQWALGK